MDSEQINSIEASTEASGAPVSRARNDDGPELAAVPDTAATQYLVQHFNRDGGNYFFQDGRKSFTDKGERITSKLDDLDTVSGMVACAREKGWQSIDVKGTPVFRRHVWYEAKRMGIEVNGYEPTPAEALLFEGQPAKEKGLNVTNDLTRGAGLDAGSKAALQQAALDEAKLSNLGITELNPDDHAYFQHMGQRYMVQQNRPGKYTVYEVSEDYARREVMKIGHDQEKESGGRAGASGPIRDEDFQALRAIETRSETYGKDANNANAKEWASLDAKDFSRIQDANLREHAAVAMHDNATDHANYKNALKEEAQGHPGMLEKIDAGHASHVAKVIEKEDRKAVQLGGLNSIESMGAGGPTKEALDASYKAAVQEAGSLMGSKVSISNPKTQDGVYQGRIIGSSSHHTIQQISPSMAVVHQTSQITGGIIGKTGVVRYNNGAGKFAELNLQRQAARGGVER